MSLIVGANLGLYELNDACGAPPTFKISLAEGNTTPFGK